jgi:predicted dienelactone hydrolase
MSLLEMLLVLGTVVLVLARWIPPGARRPVTITAVAVVVLSVLALILAGLRWQMVPVLAGAAISLPFIFSPLLRPDRPPRRAPWWLALPGSIACLGLVAASPAAAWALPIPIFPKPSGHFPVGTSVMEWTDPNRFETATPAPDDLRHIVVQFWYPARTNPAGAQRAQYLGRTQREARVVSSAFAHYSGVPGFLLDSLPRAHTNSVFDAPVAGEGGRFPIVMFSPGLGGVRTQNTAWAEELASHGYVVVALDHPYDSAAVVLTSGRTIRTKVTATGDPSKDERLAAGWTRVRAADLSFALTQLGRVDRGEIASPLAGRLNTDRVAATGHSLGGGAALKAAGQDPRFTAVIDLDGFPHDPSPISFHQPVLALTQAIGPQTDPDYIPGLTRVLNLSTATSYRLTIPGAAHLSFTDAPLFLPPLPSLVGSMGRTEGPHVAAATCIAFLDKTLRDSPGDVAATLSSYGDLSIYHPGRRN